MGGGYAAIADDATAPYWNPAGLGQLRRTEAAFMHSSLYGLDSYDFFSVAGPSAGSVWSVSWLRVGIDDIVVTRVRDADSPVSSVNRPERSRTVGVSHNAFLFGWGQRMLTTGGRHPRGELYAGATGKFLLLTAGAPAGTNAFGMGGDAALLGVWRFRPTAQVRAGLNAQDFFRTNIYWNTVPRRGAPSHKDTILANFKVAAAVSGRVPPGESSLTLGFETDSRYDFEMRYGGEWNVGNTLALRAGWIERKTDAETLRDVTAGAGFRLGFVGGQAFSADYAFTNGDVGGSHRLSLGVRF
jgi:hypothetical protein